MGSLCRKRGSPEPPRPLLWLGGLPPGRLLLLVYAGFGLGLFLPFLVAPLSLGEWRPPPKPPFWSDLGTIYLHNAFIALVVRWMPLLEGLLPPAWRTGWTGKLFLLLSAPVAGTLATPHGLPQGMWYLVHLLPLGMGEYGALVLAAYARVGPALLLLAGLALYEVWMTGRV